MQKKIPLKRIVLPLLLIFITLGGYWAYIEWLPPALSERDLEIVLQADRTAQQVMKYHYERNEDLLQRIREVVEGKGNLERDRIVLSDANRIGAMLSDIRYTCDKLRDALISSLRKTDKKITIQQMMQAPLVDKQAVRSLTKDLNTYVQTLFEICDGQVFPPLTYDVDKQPLKADDFASYYLELPLPLALYTLTRIQIEASEYAHEAMDLLSLKVDFYAPTFDKITPVVLPETIIIEEGEPYRAEVRLVGLSTRIIPKIMTPEGELSVVDGMGKLRFIAQADSTEFNERGFAYKTWEAEVTVPINSEKDTVFRVSQSYIVRKSRRPRTDLQEDEQVYED